MEAILENEFARFIEFGRIFDKTTRKYIVHFLSETLLDSSKVKEDAELLSSYQSYLSASLKRIFLLPSLQKVAKLSSQTHLQLIQDALHWIKTIDKKIIDNNPFQDEKERLEAWAHKPTFMWKKEWTILLGFLEKQYPKEKLDIQFYAYKLKEIFGNKEIKDQTASDETGQQELIIHDLLANWDALLTEKYLRFLAELIEEESTAFSELMEAKSNEFLKMVDLVTPFTIAGGNYWDVNRALWKDASFDILAKYKELLEKEEAIRELADLLGRMREAEIETEEENIQEVIEKKEWVSDEFLREEIDGLAETNDLNRVLPSEITFLGDDSTQIAFFQKYADYSLLSYHYQGKRLVHSDKVNYYTLKRQKNKEKGPFIICIDTSGSMGGLPSQIAKVLSFAIMKVAAAEIRKCYLINFSIGIKTLDLHDFTNSFDAIADFLSMSFDGGTDVTPALSEALRMIKTNDYKDADVLMISDFIMFSIPEETIFRIKQAQSNGTRFHSLTLTEKPNLEVLEVFDNYWTYLPSDKTVIRKTLAEIREMV